MADVAANWAEDLAGTLIASRYRVLGGAGAGGMGTVCVAHDTVLDRPVALKRLHDERSAALLEEARVAARLVHSNIVAIYDVFRFEGRDYLATEFLDGTPLHEAAGVDAISTIDALRVLRDLANALAHAHANDVVHGDVKAQNVALTRDGVAKLLDFGLANRDASVGSPARGHTPRALAPERLRGDPPTPAADLYALGVLLFELVAGVSPRTHMAADHDAGLRPRLREWKPEIPIELSRLADGLLDTSPELRPAAAEVADRLGALIQQLAGAEAPEQSGAEVRRVAVLAIRLPLEDAVRLDRRAHRENTEATHRALSKQAAVFGGELISALGAQLVIAFGHTAASETACHQAARLALDLGAHLGTWADATRIAIDIGDLLVARSERKWRVVGDAIDRALELAAVARPGVVFASSRAQARLAGRYTVIPHLLPARGSDAARDAAMCYEIVASSARHAGAFDATPCVGRRGEIALVREALGDATGPFPHQVLVIGEPGVGKSRLLRETVAQATRHGDGRFVVTVQGLEEAQHTPFAAMRPMLADLADFATTGVRFDDVVDEVAAAARLEPAEVVAALALARGTGDEHARQRIASLFQRERQNAVGDVVARIITAISARRPIVLAVDDAQWLDRSSAHAIDGVRTRTSPRLLVVLASRSTGADVTRIAVPGMRSVTLGRLGRADALELVAALPETRGATPSTLEALVAAADGLPLVLEQLARLGFDPTTATLREPATSLGDLVATTLERLGLAVRETLEIVAHLGDVARVDVVRRVVGPVADAHLAALTTLGLLQRDAEQAVRFSHLLVRDEVMRRVSTARTVAVHEAILDALTQSDADPALLAHHYEGANRVADAITQWVTAANAAAAIGAHGTALAQSDKALGLVASAPIVEGALDLELVVRRSRTRILAQAHGWADASVADNVRRVAGRGDVSSDFNSYFMGWMMPYAAGMIPAAIEAIGALDVYAAQSSGRGLARFVAQCARGITYLHLGRLPQAREVLAQAAESRDGLAKDLAELGVCELVVAPENYAAWAYALTGQKERALGSWRDAASITGHGPLPPLACQGFVMTLGYGLGDSELAAAGARRVLESEGLALPHRATAQVVLALHRLRHLADPSAGAIQALVAEAWAGLGPYRWDPEEPLRPRMRAGYLVTLVEGADTCLALAESGRVGGDARRAALDLGGSFVDAALHEVVDEDPAIHRYYASEAFRVAAAYATVASDRRRASDLLDEARHRAQQLDCGDAGGAWLLLDRIAAEQQRLEGVA